MRTRQLTVTIGAYADGTWHVALIETVYERGRLLGSDVVTRHHLTRETLRRQVDEAVSRAIRMEAARVEAERVRYEEDLSAALAEDDPA